jgi:hypothetical protein
MDELGAQFNNFSAIPNGMDASTHAVPRLKNSDVMARLGKSAGCSKAGHAGSHHENGAST